MLLLLATLTWTSVSPVLKQTNFNIFNTTVEAAKDDMTMVALKVELKAGMDTVKDEKAATRVALNMFLLSLLQNQAKLGNWCALLGL